MGAEELKLIMNTFVNHEDKILKILDFGANIGRCVLTLWETVVEV